MALNQTETRKLAHLLRRAGFGARPEEWNVYAEIGLEGSIDRLLHPETVPDHLQEVLKDIGGDYIDFDNIDSIKNWWLYRMVHTARPLEEKMTLFWHNHFATAFFKVNSARWMWQQNEVFRRHGLGNFRTMLQEIARDHAMLVWLDGVQNRAGQPNENFGRELLELFTMGVGSGYSETDVKEGARSFTGWRYDNDRRAFLYDPFLHDDGFKVFLGQAGNFHGDDIIDIVVRHPATAKFVCTKLYRFFVRDNPSPNDVAPLVDIYFKSGYDIRAILKAIFTSADFYAERNLFAKIKSPTEFVVTTMRTLNAPMLAVRELPRTVAEMGQDLFNPPNVKGWIEGPAWINTRTLLMRVNFASELANEMARRGVLATLIEQGMLGAQIPAAAEQTVDAMWEALMPGQTPPAATRKALVDYLAGGNNRVVAHDRLPGLLNLIMAAPEYQLA